MNAENWHVFYIPKIMLKLDRNRWIFLVIKSVQPDVSSVGEDSFRFNSQVTRTTFD